VANGLLPRVRDIADPLVLGIHPSILGTSGGRVPSYVPRQVDVPLRSALATGGFVLVVGNSAAGKTRTAYEAMRAEIPDHWLLVPRRAGTLRALVEAGFKIPEETVVWVNDLERYLVRDGLDQLLLDRILSGTRNVVVLATIRRTLYGNYLQGQSGQAPAREMARSARETIEAATSRIDIGSFGPAELELARASSDPRVRQAGGRARNGAVTAYLADGPALVEIWLAAWSGHPVAAALVAAAVDVRRAGLTRPADRGLLVSLFSEYLKRRDLDLPAEDEPAITSSFAWACDPHDRATGLLASRERGRQFEAFDYLVDHVQRDPQAEPIPDFTWRGCIEHTDSAELGLIAQAAFSMQRRDIAEAALRKGAAAGDPSLMNALAILLGREAEAEAWFRRAAERGYQPAVTNLGALLNELGRRSEAESWYQQAVVHGELGAMVNLGAICEDNGDDQAAEAWYLRTIEGLRPEDAELARIPTQEQADSTIGQRMQTAATMAMTALASMYARNGNTAEAEAWYLKAAELDDPRAMIGLAELLAGKGLSELAVKWREQASRRGERPRYR
jgi:TPR repeat protein